MSFLIPLSDLDYGPEEEAAVLRVLRSKWLSMGPEVQAFEDEFAAMQGAPHAFAVSNATAGLHLSLLALGLGAGDEIIQPALNFVATANMTVAIGATPVFADVIGIDEPTLDPAHVERLITARTKAVVVMHYGGNLCRMAEFTELCRRHGLALIEDACHAVGARYTPPSALSTQPSAFSAPLSALRTQHSALSPQHSALSTQPSTSLRAGSIGDISAFSFFANKNLATGEGGMVVTNRDDLAGRVRLLRSHGMTTLTWDRHKGHAGSYDVVANGYNYRLDELHAALGREQLKKLDRNNQRRRELTALYWEKLAPLETRGWTSPFRTLSTFKPPLSSFKFPVSNFPSCHLMVAIAPDKETRWRCAEALQAAAIQTSLHYPFIPDFTGFRGKTKAGSLPHSQAFCQRVITLPLYPTLTPEQVETVCRTLTAEC